MLLCNFSKWDVPKCSFSKWDVSGCNYNVSRVNDMGDDNISEGKVMSVNDMRDDGI